MKINKNGYWEEICNHHTDYGLLESLVSISNDMSSFVDFGCGDASYIREILNKNPNKDLRVRAFDGNPSVSIITKGIGEQLDLSQPFNLNETFEVVISLEVAEHIPKEFEDIYIENITKHSSKYIIISWAVPGQGGKGHVNEQSNEYVLNLFKQLAYTHEEEITQYLRNSITNCSWFRNTLFVFKK